MYIITSSPPQDSNCAETERERLSYISILLLGLLKIVCVYVCSNRVMINIWSLVWLTVFVVVTDIRHVQSDQFGKST